MIEISRCPAARAHDVMAFIDQHWSKGHILARDSEFMSWQHGDNENKNELNWLIATKGSEILGIIGYIPFRIFSGAVKDGRRVVWVALWKVRGDAEAGVGIRLLKAIERWELCDALGVLGLNPAHPPLYRKLGFQTGELTHFMGVHQNKKDIKIIKHPENWSKPVLLGGDARLKKFDLSLNESINEKNWFNQGIKNDQYFLNRYVRHPKYKYLVYRVVIGEQICGTIAFRIATVGAEKVLRIIDFSGTSESFGRLGTAFSELLEENESEYIDLWSHGLGDEVIKQLGMIEVQKCDGLVVPNYFEPFVQKNGKIAFALKGFENLNYLVMRGDGDQDRPC